MRRLATSIDAGATGASKSMTTLALRATLFALLEGDVATTAIANAEAGSVANAHATRTRRTLRIATSLRCRPAARPLRAGTLNAKVLPELFELRLPERFC